MLKLAAILLSIVLLGACSPAKQLILKQAEATPTPRQTKIDEEEYELFSALLNQDSSKSTRLHIILNKSEHDFPGRCKLDVTSFSQKILAKYPTLMEALNNFDERKDDSITFENRFNLKKEYKLISNDYLNSFYENKNGGDGWEAFRKAHPSCASPIVFSRVGFDKLKNIAIVYSRSRTNTGDGDFGGYLLLSKLSGNWKLIDGFCQWDS